MERLPTTFCACKLPYSLFLFTLPSIYTLRKFCFRPIFFSRFLKNYPSKLDCGFNGDNRLLEAPLH